VESAMRKRPKLRSGDDGTPKDISN
jgi:hypothetical protein